MIFWLHESSYVSCSNCFGFLIKQLSQKIEKLEKANLAQKPWQMSGETGGSIRPINSLLEDDVDFDHMTTTGRTLFDCFR